ncbi:exosortase C-terminal domain/associated protein EpsI, partial [Pseudomonadota bacterium]
VLVHEKNKTWRVVDEHTQVLWLEESLQTPLATLSSSNNRLLVTYLYYVAGEVVTSKYQTKLLQAKAKLLGDYNDGAVIIFSTNLQEDGDSASVLLKKFASAMLPQVKAVLDGMEPKYE